MQQSFVNRASKCRHEVEEEDATKEEGPESDARALFTASLDADRLVVLVITV